MIFDLVAQVMPELPKESSSWQNWIIVGLLFFLGFIYRIGIKIGKWVNEKYNETVTNFDNKFERMITNIDDKFERATNDVKIIHKEGISELVAIRETLLKHELENKANFDDVKKEISIVKEAVKKLEPTQSQNNKTKKSA